MRFIFCIIGVLLYSGLSAQQMSVLSTDSTYNIVRELQEVVVTAEKRELNPGDIPTALTVITPRSIPGENNPDLRNISGIVPNFYMQEGGLKLSTPLYIRGNGTDTATPPHGLTRCTTPLSLIYTTSGKSKCCADLKRPCTGVIVSTV